MLSKLVQGVCSTKSGADYNAVYVQIVGVGAVVLSPLAILVEVGLEDALLLGFATNAAHCLGRSRIERK